MENIGYEQAVSMVRSLLKFVGDDPDREGLKETPDRVVSSWLSELFWGYSVSERDIEDMLKQFDSEGYDQLVVVRDIDFFSVCEHHMLPFFGKVNIAYLPNDKVVGISKLVRLVEIVSRRLQVQERMTQQIADLIYRWVGAVGVAVIVSAQHLCMRMRGVKQSDAFVTTSELLGAFREDYSLRSEVLSLLNGGTAWR